MDLRVSPNWSNKSVSQLTFKKKSLSSEDFFPDAKTRTDSDFRVVFFSYSSTADVVPFAVNLSHCLYFSGNVSSADSQEDEKGSDLSEKVTAHRLFEIQLLHI